MNDFAVILTVIVIVILVYRIASQIQMYYENKNLERRLKEENAQKAKLDLEQKQKVDKHKEEQLQREKKMKIQEENKLKEEKRIIEERFQRPSLEAKSLSSDCSYIPIDSKDYIDVKIEGGTYQIKLAYLSQDDIKKIETSDDKEWAEREMLFDNCEGVTILRWINKVELGTTEHFRIDEKLPDPADMETSFKDFVTGLLGEPEDDVVAITYEVITTKNTYIFGTNGLSEKLLDIEDISFFDTFIRVGKDFFNYTDFCSEDISSFNPVYEGRIEMEEIEDYDSIWDLI